MTRTPVARTTAHVGRQCPVCGQTQAATVRVVHAKRDCFGEPLRLATCGACGGCYQPVVPTNEELGQWYRYMGEVPRLSTLTPLLQRRLARIVDELQPFARGGRGRVLEVGCGGGLFVRVARDLGWDVYATDVSASCCDLLRPVLGAHLFHGDVKQAPFAAASFDAVVMMEVVEHLTCPAHDLAHIHALLRPGGAIYLTTPNLSGVTAHVRGGAWRAIVDEHLNYFTPATLERLLLRTGFASVQLRTSYVDIANLLGRPAHDDSSNPAGGSPAATARLRPRLADEAIAIANRLVAATGRGDTLRALAVKPAV